LRSTQALAAWLGGFLICAVSLAGQSVDKAETLFENGLNDDAKRILVEIVYSADHTEAEKAAALDLLGDIAVDEKRFEAARESWEGLVRAYPDTPAAESVDGKLALLDQLDAQGNDATAPDPPAIQGPDLTGYVIVTGVSPEAPQFLDQAAAEFVNFLGARGVKAAVPPGGHQAAMGKGVAQLAREAGAASVLYVNIHFRGVENMKVKCYGPEGTILWEEKVAASTSLTKAGKTEGFIRRMSKKLEKRVGGPGLPRSP